MERGAGGGGAARVEVDAGEAHEGFAPDGVAALFFGEAREDGLGFGVLAPELVVAGDVQVGLAAPRVGGVGGGEGEHGGAGLVPAVGVPERHAGAEGFVADGREAGGVFGGRAERPAVRAGLFHGGGGEVPGARGAGERAFGLGGG